MAEDFAGEKTEQATPRKRQEARENGQVARSNDLSTAVLLLSAFTLIYALGEHLITRLSGLYRIVLGHLHERITVDNVLAVAPHWLLWIVISIFPVIGALFVVAFATSLAQVGWGLSPSALVPNLNKINPLSGLKRVFSIRGLMRLLFGIVKLIIVGAVLYFGYAALLEPTNPDNFLSLIHIDIASALIKSKWVVFRVGAQASVALLILAILDYGYQRWQHEQDLKMTKEEVKEEHKRMEGDPKVRERRRRIGQQLALQRMIHDVPTADVVITNPTHVACAIRYRDADMSAPRLVAKGQGHVALRIRQVAETNDIMIVEEAPLARMIYSTTEVGDEIPPELYEAVAKVLAYVYRVRGRRHQREAVLS